MVKSDEIRLPVGINKEYGTYYIGHYMRCYILYSIPWENVVDALLKCINLILNYVYFKIGWVPTVVRISENKTYTFL